MCKAIDDMIADSRAEGIAVGKAEGIAVGKAEGIAVGKAEGKAEGRESALRDSIRNVMGNLHVSITKAMDILNIPEDERFKYLQ